jgi:hypothetical protein
MRRRDKDEDGDSQRPHKKKSRQGELDDSSWRKKTLDLMELVKTQIKQGQTAISNKKKRLPIPPSYVSQIRRLHKNHI